MEVSEWSEKNILCPFQAGDVVAGHADPQACPGFVRLGTDGVGFPLSHSVDVGTIHSHSPVPSLCPNRLQTVIAPWAAF